MEIKDSISLFEIDFMMFNMENIGIKANQLRIEAEALAAEATHPMSAPGNTPDQSCYKHTTNLIKLIIANDDHQCHKNPVAPALS